MAGSMAAGTEAGRPESGARVRIGIDYTSAAHQGAGIGRLTRSLVRALAERDRENQYTLLIRGRELPFAPPDVAGRNVASGITNDRFREVRTRIDERWWDRIWHRLRLPVPVEWVIGPVDVFHSPDFTLPPTLRRTRCMVTVHDLSFLRLPECYEPVLFRYLSVEVPRAVRRADWVLADSKSTRCDLIELLRVPAERISVIYPAADPGFHPIQDPDVLSRVQLKYGLPPRFVLSVGTLQPRKNYVRLIQAMARLHQPEVKLVIVGGKGWLFDEVFTAIQEQGLQEQVLILGFVDETDLPVLYNLAEVFCFPSLYEGFGIPPLEAMACGTPVIAADNSSLPEAVGDAGILIDASSTEELTCALQRLLQNPALRRELVERGRIQVSKFSWDEAAKRLLDIYRRLGVM